MMDERTPTSRLAGALVALIAVGSLAANCGDERQQVATPATTRDPSWAVPLERPGLPNLHKVSDNLYRGAQPEPAGFAELAKLGVKTVVNLRSMHSDRDELAKSGLPEGTLGYEHIRMTAWNPEHDEIVRFIRIVADPRRQPVFVHCQHGADRTGTVVAAYRAVVQGWTREDALREMTEGGFGFHTIWTNLPDYVLELDVQRIRREAGIEQ